MRYVFENFVKIKLSNPLLKLPQNFVKLCLCSFLSLTFFAVFDFPKTVYLVFQNWNSLSQHSPHIMFEADLKVFFQFIFNLDVFQSKTDQLYDCLPVDIPLLIKFLQKCCLIVISFSLNKFSFLQHLLKYDRYSTKKSRIVTAFCNQADLEKNQTYLHQGMA